MIPDEGLLCVSAPKVLSSISVFTQQQIKLEPMFFSSDVDFVYRHGGSVARAFIEQLPTSWLTNTVLDSKTLMLMPGWYPCIPGWHHDDVPRGPGGQPNYINPEYRSNHIMCLAGAAVCPTEFAIGTILLPTVLEGQVVYKHWNTVIDQAVAAGQLTVLKAQEGQLIEFDDRALHRGTLAVGNGWRHFIRISQHTHRRVFNEIRNQVQVYLPEGKENEGW